MLAAEQKMLDTETMHVTSWLIMDQAHCGSDLDNELVLIEGP